MPSDETTAPKDSKSESKPKVKKAKQKKRAKAASSAQANFPRHTLDRALRIPKAIIEQNAGKECSEKEAASYLGVGVSGPFRVELSSAIKSGFLVRPRTGLIG